MHELTDFQEARRYSSHKFSMKAALSYEIALALWRKKVCFTNGPFPGATSDITIYRSKLKDMIPDGKKVIGDRLYKSESGPEGTTCVRNRLDPPDVAEFKTRGRGRHETFNAAVKKFRCMREWRHEYGKHVICFDAVIVMLQHCLDCGDELFDIAE